MHFEKGVSSVNIPKKRLAHPTTGSTTFANESEANGGNEKKSRESPTEKSPDDYIRWDVTETITRLPKTRKPLDWTEALLAPSEYKRGEPSPKTSGKGNLDGRL